MLLEKATLWGSTSALLFAAAQFAVTPSLWFEPVAFDVPDVQALTLDTPVAYDRIIRRDFDGRWQIEVVRLVDGGTEFACATNWHDVPYRADNVLPDVVTWGWMLDGDDTCLDLTPGQYQVTLTWQINIHSAFIRRQISRADRFSIVEAAAK